MALAECTSRYVGTTRCRDSLPSALPEISPWMVPGRVTRCESCTCGESIRDPARADLTIHGVVNSLPFKYSLCSLWAVLVTLCRSDQIVPTYRQGGLFKKGGNENNRFNFFRQAALNSLHQFLKGGISHFLFIFQAFRLSGFQAFRHDTFLLENSDYSSLKDS